MTDVKIDTRKLIALDVTCRLQARQSARGSRVHYEHTNKTMYSMGEGHSSSRSLRPLKDQLLELGEEWMNAVGWAESSQLITVPSHLKS